MTTYSTNLKTWGDAGTEYPNSYSYAEGEQPVDDWDNFFNSNVVSDIEAVIGALNDDVVQVDGSNDIAGTLSFSSGNLDLNETARITNLAESTSGSLEWNLDQATARTFGRLRFNDASGDDVVWDADIGNNVALKVRNLTTSNDLFTANDGGLVEVPSGSLEVNNNITLGTGVNTPRIFLEESGTRKVGIYWSPNQLYSNIRNEVDSSDWFRLKPSTHADGKRVDVLNDLHLSGSLLNVNVIEGRGGIDALRTGTSDASSEWAIQKADASTVFSAQGDGLVEVHQGDLRIPTGNAIEDGGGAGRITFAAGETKYSDEQSRYAFQARGGTANRVHAHSDTNVQITDNEGSFAALNYSTSASAPGTLTLDANTFIKDGKFVVGGTSLVTTIDNFTQNRQFQGTGGGDEAVTIGRWSNDNGSPFLIFAKSRGTSIGGTGAVSNGDYLFTISGAADDGSDLDNRASAIYGRVDGSVSTDTVPSRIEFHTTSSAGALRRALVLNSSQQILAAQDGSTSAPAISFTGDTDTGIFRQGNDRFDLVGGGTSVLRVDGGASVLNIFEDVTLGGHALRQVGGTTDSSTGAIRLANNSQINARNVDDTANVIALNVDTNDDIAIGTNHRRTVLVAGSDSLTRFDGQDLIQIGGKTDASTGAARFANATSILARNAGDTADFGIDFNASDQVALNNADLLVPGSQSIDVQGTVSLSGTIDDGSGNTIADSVVASGAVSLSSGVATVSTGVVSTTSGNADATFYVAMGTDTDDAKVSARIYEDSADDTYKVEFIESGTSVGTFSVDYDIIRVR